MEFNEKLQKLRKSRELTQEELSEALFVSRTAISKWESGRGFPSIDSLKEIADYFSVTIDDLISSEKILSVAEKENNCNIYRLCNLLFGIIDILVIGLIFLPLYPNQVNGYVYSVNLFSYLKTSVFNRVIHWILYIMLIMLGIVKVLLTKLKICKGQDVLTICSMSISILTVLLLSVTRESYAIIAAFLLLIIKVILILEYSKRK